MLPLRSPVRGCGSFSELRGEKAAKKQHMENTCFICSVDRFTFETKGGGFERHIRDDHNMWNYLYLMVYLREKDPTEYNGWEQYVADKIKAEDTSFIPSNNAIVLKEHKEREAREGESRRRLPCLRPPRASSVVRLYVVYRQVPYRLLLKSSYWRGWVAL